MKHSSLVLPDVRSLFADLRANAKVALFIPVFLLPVTLYFGILYRFSLPVPFLDDFNAVLNFLVEQSHLHGLVPHLISIVEFQHGDYRWIFPHFLMEAQVAVSGQPNFSFYILAGNIFMLPTAYLFWLHSFRGALLSRRLLLFMPVFYLLFQLTYVEMLDFASAGVQFLVLPFTLGAIHLLLRRNKTGFFWASSFAVLACMTAPQGFFLGPLGLIVLFSQRVLWRSILWCLTLALTLFVYLYRYHPAPHPTSFSLKDSLLFFLSLVGGCIENMHRQPVPYAGGVLGVILCLTFAQSIRRGLYKTNPFLFLAATWIFLTAALITYARTGFGLPQSLSVRYKLYCSTLLAISYLFWAHRFYMRPDLSARWKTLLYSAGLTLSVLFCLAADFVGYRFISQRHDRILDAYAYYQRDPLHNAPYINYQINGRDNEEAKFERDSLNAAIAAGIYTPPSVSAATVP